MGITARIGKPIEWNPDGSPKVQPGYTLLSWSPATTSNDDPVLTYSECEGNTDDEKDC